MGRLTLRGTPARGLPRYVFAATLVRSADGGAVVAIVLLSHASGHPGWASGLLGASITLPHLLGPLIARRLDTARDGRRVIALSAVAHGVLLGLAALLIPTAFAPGAALLLIASGLVGPMLTGGISSRLPAIAGSSQRSQRRAQSWDVASYGISGTLGPAAVAWIAATPAGPLWAALALALAAVLGAGAVLALPPQPPLADADDAPSPRDTLLRIRSSGPLRRTLGLTVMVAFSVASLPIYAVAFAAALGDPARSGALVAAYGVGNLAGSAMLMARPLRGDADRLNIVLALVVAAALAFVILAPGIGALAAFAAAGIANAWFFAATLAARSEYAPPEARGQVFIWVGALKIAAGSAGTAFAGALIVGAAWLPLALAAAATTITALCCAVGRARR